MSLSIILEGYDGAGKSTLATALQKYLINKGLHYHIYVAGPPAKNDEHAIDCCEQQLKCVRETYILDRVTPISRACYQVNLGFEHTIHLAKYLHNMLDDAIVIWCKPDEYVHIVKEHDTDEHIRDIEDRKHNILSGYNVVFKYTPHVIFNKDTMVLDEFCEKIYRMVI